MFVVLLLQNVLLLLLPLILLQPPLLLLLLLLVVVVVLLSLFMMMMVMMMIVLLVIWITARQAETEIENDFNIDDLVFQQTFNSCLTRLIYPIYLPCKKKFGLPHSVSCPVTRNVNDEECLPLVSVSKEGRSLF